jgi:hypothetical protein
MGSSPVAICSRVCELGVEWSSSMYCFVNLSLSLIQWRSPVDVGVFAEPRKILCQCALSLLWATISTPPVRAWGCRKPQQTL